MKFCALRTFSWAIAVLSVVAPATIHAECITVTADALMRQTTSEVIFSGTVVEVARTADLGYRATFDVERVWKGSVTRRFDLWVCELAPEIPRFEAGRRYVVAAHRMTGTRHRQGAGLGDSAAVVYTPAMCSDPPSLAKDIEQALGLGYLPQ